jgi:hypothetical protein
MRRIGKSGKGKVERGKAETLEAESEMERRDCEARGPLDYGTTGETLRPESRKQQGDRRPCRKVEIGKAESRNLKAEGGSATTDH